MASASPSSRSASAVSSSVRSSPAVCRHARNAYACTSQSAIGGSGSEPSPLTMALPESFQP